MAFVGCILIEISVVFLTIAFVTGAVVAAWVAPGFAMAVSGVGVVSELTAPVGAALVGADAGGSGFFPITMSDGTVGGGPSGFGASGFGFSCEMGDRATGGSAGNSGNSIGQRGMESLQPINSAFR